MCASKVSPSNGKPRSAAATTCRCRFRCRATRTICVAGSQPTISRAETVRRHWQRSRAGTDVEDCASRPLRQEKGKVVGRLREIQPLAARRIRLGDVVIGSPGVERHSNDRRFPRQYGRSERRGATWRTSRLMGRFSSSDDLRVGHQSPTPVGARAAGRESGSWRCRSPQARTQSSRSRMPRRGMRTQSGRLFSS